MSYTWTTSTPEGAGSQGGKRTKISHNVISSLGSMVHGHTPNITSWDINDSLAADFDGSLSGLGTELGTASYNMR